MDQIIIEKAAAQFVTGHMQIKPLGSGLIHRTYEVNSITEGKKIVLQCLNQHTFPQPENIINNYKQIYNYLQLQHPGRIVIPAMVLTHHGKLFWVDESDNFWRATEFMLNTYSPSVSKNPQEAYEAAKCFGVFTRLLSGIDLSSLNIIIPNFHDLKHRYNQFEDAINEADIKRLLKSTHLIAELRQRVELVSFYESMRNNPAYVERVMHHDCKINNVLFDTDTNLPVCPVDLDTTMPGYFFSDFGDMIRTMACTVDENSTEWENIGIEEQLYQSIMEGYLHGIGNMFETEEKNRLHISGLIMTYMQALRFLTDFLDNDIYYKTTYAEQNLNRALNQFILLERLEEFLKKKYEYFAYTA
jgi:hypothetical protein